MKSKFLKLKDPDNLFFADMTTNYMLAQDLDLEGYLFVQSRIRMISINLKNVAATSLSGEKKFYNEIKEIVEKQIKEFFKAHDQLCEELFIKNNKDKH